MARLWLGNIERRISDEDIRNFLQKYGLSALSEIQQVSHDGPRPAVILTFANVDADALRNPRERIHDLYWRKGRIVAQMLKDDFA
ncbi:RNA-binding protein [Variovorax rhizosphaerae]|uniref:RNA-binding protein n=1 Tax=Variovorax rhizosphaerae TaxID=1836200 RepID=A0ABU8WYR7_9BURK